MNRLLMASGAAILAMATAASAASLNISGGIYDNVPGAQGTQPSTPQNDVLDKIFGLNATLGGYLGSTITLDAASMLKVELIGWEAGFLNTFTIDGKTVGKYTNGSGGDGLSHLSLGNVVALDDFFTSVLPAGTLSFNFKSDGGVNGSVSNGSNPTLGPNFFASFGPGNEQATSGKVLWLFYDDAGQPGDNHDDLVVRISAVPLPAGGLLLLTGLGALSLRRRKQA